MHKVRHPLPQDCKQIRQRPANESCLLVQNVNDEIRVRVIKADEKLIRMLYLDVPRVERRFRKMLEIEGYDRFSATLYGSCHHMTICWIISHQGDKRLVSFHPGVSKVLIELGQEALYLFLRPADLLHQRV